PSRAIQLVKADRKPFVDPKEDNEKPKEKDKRRGKANVPVVIVPEGNRLLIRTDDPEAMATIQALIRFLTQSPGEGDFEYIKVNNVSAVDMAKVLDELFNGAKQQNQQPNNPFPRFGGGFGGFGGFVGRFGGPQVQPPPPEATKNPIRVVADPQTNGLLVKGTPLQVMTVRRILRVLDAATKAPAAIKTWPPIKLRYADATEVQDTIEKVYRESINNNPTTTTGGPLGFRGAIFARLGGNQNIDASGNPRAVTLSVGVDERSNS